MRPFPQLSKVQYEQLAAFRYGLRTFLRFSEAAAQSAGVTPKQYQALLVVVGYPGRECVTVGELAASLLIRHHSAVGLVDRLVKKKLAKRASPARDRRQVYVRLTTRGERILGRVATANRERLRGISHELTPLLSALGARRAVSNNGQRDSRV